MTRNRFIPRFAGVAAFAMIAALGALPAGPAEAATSAQAFFSRDDIKAMVIQEAALAGIPEPIALAVAKVESDFQANARSTRGAVGVMQVMPKNADELGVNEAELLDPKLNIQVALDRLGDLKAEHGTWELALAVWHSGRVAYKDGVAVPVATSQAYIDAVLRWAARYEAQASLWAKLEDREQEWWPSRSSVADAGGDRAPASEATPREVPEAGEKYPHVRVVWNRGGNGFDAEWVDMDQRRLQAAYAIDDFGPRAEVVERAQR